MRHRGRPRGRRPPHRGGHPLALGQALREALGDKAGHAALRRRPGAAGRVRWCRPRSTFRAGPYLVHGEPDLVELIGTYDTTLTRHIWESFVATRADRLHVRVLAGRNAHHVVEAQFKAVARALRDAVALDPRVGRACPAPRARCEPVPRRAVVVLDYGSGNLRSAERALARVGAEVTVTADPAPRRDGRRPRGARRRRVRRVHGGLRAVGGDDVVRERLADERPVLGHLRRHAGAVRARRRARRGHPASACCRAWSTGSSRRCCRTWAGTPSTPAAGRAVGRQRATTGSTSCTPTPRRAVRRRAVSDRRARPALRRRGRAGALAGHAVPPREVRRRRAALLADWLRIRDAPCRATRCPSLVLLPAVDVADGQAVRLVQGEAGTETSYGDPLEAALRLAARRRRVGAPGRPRRRLRPRVEPRAARRGRRAPRRRRSSCPAASATTRRWRRRWPPAAPGSTSAPPPWSRRTGSARAIAEHGDRIAVGLDVRGTTLAARGWTAGRRRALRGPRPARRRRLRPLRRHRRPPRRHAHRPQPRAARRRLRRHRPAGGRQRRRLLPRRPARHRRVVPGVEGAIVGKALYAGEFTLPEALAAVR